MLEQFRKIAKENNYTLAFGTNGQFNQRIEKIVTYPILYIEGYSDGTKAFNASGKLVTTYKVSMWLFQRKPFTVSAEEHAKELDILEEAGDKVLRTLVYDNKLSSTDFIQVAGVKIVEKMLDGIRYNFNATPLVQKKQC